MKVQIKYFTLIILITFLALSLCSCKSEEVANVESLISDIGTVSFESKDKIEAAENAYNSLPDEEKKQVGNYAELTEAKTAYDDLGIQLTLENYKDYLDINVTGEYIEPVDAGEVWNLTEWGYDDYLNYKEMYRDTGIIMYKGYKVNVQVNGVSNKYDYNDVIIEIKVTGRYAMTSEAEISQSYKNFDRTLTIHTNIAGEGSDSFVINEENNAFYTTDDEPAVINTGYEVVEISGFLVD